MRMVKRRLWSMLFVVLTVLTTFTISIFAQTVITQQGCCLPLGSTYCVSPCTRDQYLGDWYHCHECTDGRGVEWCCWYHWKRYLCRDRQPPYSPCHPPYQRELQRRTADEWWVCRVYYKVGNSASKLDRKWGLTCIGCTKNTFGVV